MSVLGLSGDRLGSRHRGRLQEAATRARAAARGHRARRELDPAVIEKLLTREAKSDSVDPMDLDIGGIITATSGTGV